VNTSDSGILRQEEQRWLDMIKPEELKRRYYNQKLLAAGGNGGANRGIKHSEQSIRNMSGRVPTIEHRAAAGAPHRGRPKSPEQRAKMSAAAKGRKKSSEHIKNMTESRVRNRILNGPKAQTAEHVEKRARKIRGVPKSEAHRQALSESHRRRHAGKKSTLEAFMS
jgi:hypothetical protein